MQLLQHSAMLRCEHCVSHKGLYREQHRRKHTKFLRKHAPLRTLLRTTLVHQAYRKCFRSGCSWSGFSCLHAHLRHILKHIQPHISGVESKLTPKVCQKAAGLFLCRGVDPPGHVLANCFHTSAGSSMAVFTQGPSPSLSRF